MPRRTAPGGGTGPGGRRTAIVTIAMATVIALIGAGCGVGTPPADATELVGGPAYPLFDHTVTWTGDDLLVVGGAGGDPGDGELVDDPLAWNPSGGFRSIGSPPGPPRNRQAAVWTGDELVIWSGTSRPYGVADGLLHTAAAYDPAADTWRTLADSPPELGRVRAVGTRLGDRLVFAGSGTPDTADADRVAVYDLGRDRWSEIRAGGETIAVAGDGAERAWLLTFGPSTDEDDGGGGRPLRLSRLVPTPDGVATDAGAVDDLGGSWTTASLGLAGDRLVVWGTTSARDGITVAVSGPVAGNGIPETWSHQEIDPEVRTESIDRRAAGTVGREPPGPGGRLGAGLGRPRRRRHDRPGPDGRAELCAQVRSHGGRRGPDRPRRLVHLGRR